MVEDRDVAARDVVRAQPGSGVDEQVAVAVVERSARQRAEARALRIAAAKDDRVVACDRIVAGAAVDHVSRVDPASHVVPADDVVVPRLAPDPVGALTTEDDVVARPGVNLVVAAEVGCLGVDRGEDERVGERREGQGARVDGATGHCEQAPVIAEDEVVACAGVDHIASGAAEHEVVARAGGDRVAAAVDRVGRRDAVDVGGQRVVTCARQRVRALGRGVVDVAVVAEHDVVAVPGIDRIVEHAAEHDVLAGSRDDRVVAAAVRRNRGEEPERDRLGAELRRVRMGGADLAVVAEDDVHAVAGVDRVAAEATRVGDGGPDEAEAVAGEGDQLSVLAADHDVVAVTGGDCVVAAGVRLQAPDTVDRGWVRVVAGERPTALYGSPVDQAGVADHDVVPVTGTDRVRADAAQDDVGLRAGGDRVAAADERLDRRDETERDRLVAKAVRVGAGSRDLAVVAEDEVAAFTGIDDVAPDPGGVGRNVRRPRARRRASRLGNDLAVFPADHHIRARPGRDHVGAAGVRVERPDAVDRRRIAVDRRVVDEAVVAEHDVAARRGRHRLVAVGRDGVGVDAADDDVVAEAGGHLIVATDRGVDARDVADRARHAVGLVAGAAIAQHGHREGLELRLGEPGCRRTP